MSLRGLLVAAALLLAGCSTAPARPVPLVRPVLELVVEKSRLRPGDEVKLTARLRNAGTEAVVIARLEGPHPWHAWARLDRVTHRGASVLPYTPPEPPGPSTFASAVRTIDESLFERLEPGATRVLFTRTFRDVETAWRSGIHGPLEPGSYQAVASYRFSPEETVDYEHDIDSLDFAGDARALWREAWRGTLDARAFFEVSEKD